MNYFIAVFKSRTQVMRFQGLLESYRIPSAVINTPREASLGCGLSVKFSAPDMNRVSYLLHSDRFYSFAGIFLVTENGNRRTVRPY